MIKIRYLSALICIFLLAVLIVMSIAVCNQIKIGKTVYLIYEKLNDPNSVEFINE